MGCTIDTRTGKRKDDADDAIIDENGKITFDRRLFDFETYQAVIDKVSSFDYQKIKLATGDVSKLDASFGEAS